MKISRVGAVIFLIVVALVAVGVYFALEKVSNHPVESVNFSDNLTEVEKNQLSNLIAPMIANGYYDMEVEKITDAIANLSWVANVTVIQSSGFALDIKVVKDQVMFLFNQSDYLNQYLKPRNLTQSIKEQIKGEKIPHIYCKNGQIEIAIAFYNKLLEKFQSSEIEASLVSAIEITELIVTEINQIKMGIDFFDDSNHIEAVVHFGTFDFEKKITDLIDHLDQIIAEMIAIKLNRKVNILLDLRHPKGFSVREIY